MKRITTATRRVVVRGDAALVQRCTTSANLCRRGRNHQIGGLRWSSSTKTTDGASAPAPEEMTSRAISIDTSGLYKHKRTQSISF